MVTKAASTAASQDYTPLIIGAAALLVLAKFGLDQVPDLTEVKDKANIVPETGEFLSGLFSGAQTEYYYHPDQSGSPNPPSRRWWELDVAGADAGPIELIDATSVPTSPIIGTIPPSKAETWGDNVRSFFTEGKIFPRTPLGDW
jgi:hypothetical protein